MIKSVLQSIPGIEVYYVISLLLFITVFLLIVVRVIGIKKNDIKRYSLLPLEDPAPNEQISIPRAEYEMKGED